MSEPKARAEPSPAVAPLVRRYLEQLARKGGSKREALIAQARRLQRVLGNKAVSFQRRQT